MPAQNRLGVHFQLSVAVGLHLLLSVACSESPSAPWDGRRLTPSFDYQPATTTDTICSANEDHNTHLSVLIANFHPPGDTVPRVRCGALPFDEDTLSPGLVMLRWQLSDANQYQRWTRRTRNAVTGLDGVEESFGTAYYTVAPDTSVTYAVAANDKNELVAFAHRRASSLSLLDSGEINAKAQVWRSLPAPSSLTLTVVNSYQVRVGWTNNHDGRTTDSTQVFRFDGVYWQPLAYVDGDSTGYTDTPPNSGTWSYYVRHVTALVVYHSDGTDDVGDMPRPNSQATASSNILVPGPPPPASLLCEGNFAPTMDCTWVDSVETSGATTDLRRGPFGGGAGEGFFVGSAPFGTYTFTDTNVVRNASYTYAVRHVKSGVSGALGASVGAFSAPVPPEDLSCGGTTTGRVDCAWVTKEPTDTVEVYRRFGFPPQPCKSEWLSVTLVNPGANALVDTGLSDNLVYCYKIRYRKGSETTAFSNEDNAHPGQGEPYGPQP